jgi:tRNA-binding EMAP/Myf-like protein
LISHCSLASIQIVESVSPHTNADSLELCQILGWQVVTRIGEAKPGSFVFNYLTVVTNVSPGEKVVYCEIDSILPLADWLPEAVRTKIESQPKKEKQIRLKTLRLRGEYSQGLIIPFTDSLPLDKDALQIGADVTELLGIKKYEPPALSGSFAVHRNGGVPRVKTFPSDLVSKTDETRVQSQPKRFKLLQVRKSYSFILPVTGHSFFLLRFTQGQPYYATVKCDGTSGTFLLRPEGYVVKGELEDEEVFKMDEDQEVEKLLVCSRNMVREKPVDLSIKSCPYWYVAKKYNLREKLEQYPHLAIQVRNSSAVFGSFTHSLYSLSTPFKG